MIELLTRRLRPVAPPPAAAAPGGGSPTPNPNPHLFSARPPSRPPLKHIAPITHIHSVERRLFTSRNRFCRHPPRRRGTPRTRNQNLGF